MITSVVTSWCLFCRGELLWCTSVHLNWSDPGQQIMGQKWLLSGQRIHEKISISTQVGHWFVKILFGQVAVYISVTALCGYFLIWFPILKWIFWLQFGNNSWTKWVFLPIKEQFYGGKQGLLHLLAFLYKIIDNFSIFWGILNVNLINYDNFHSI